MQGPLGHGKKNLEQVLAEGAQILLGCEGGRA